MSSEEQTSLISRAVRYPGVLVGLTLVTYRKQLYASLTANAPFPLEPRYRRIIEHFITPGAILSCLDSSQEMLIGVLDVPLQGQVQQKGCATGTLSQITQSHARSRSVFLAR